MSLYPIFSPKVSVMDPFTDLANLAHGYRADLGVGTTGSNVDTWADQVGDLDCVDVGTAPTFVASAVNGQPAIRFAGGGLGGNPPPGSDTLAIDYMLMWVMSWDARVSGNGRFMTRYIGDKELLSEGAENVIDMGGSAVANDTALAYDTWVLVREHFTNSTADYLQINAGTPTTGENAGNIEFQKFTFGSASNGTTPTDFDLAECLVLSAELAGSEETDYLAYVTSRYGIAM